jgi:hypothetical protein
VDARNSTEIATIAPHPGFVRLEGAAHDGDDDDDDGIITVPPPLNRTPIRRENTEVPVGYQEHPDLDKLEDLPHDD